MYDASNIWGACSVDEILLSSAYYWMKLSGDPHRKDEYSLLSIEQIAYLLP